MTELSALIDGMEYLWNETYSNFVDAYERGEEPEIDGMEYLWNEEYAKLVDAYEATKKNS